MASRTPARTPAAGWLDAFEESVEAFVERRRVPGAAVGVWQGGEPRLLRGFGLRDVEAGRPVTPDTRFGVASLTKSFTALTLLRLEAEGALSIDDPLAAHLPEFAYPGLDPAHPVRLVHLLSHTSGLPPLPALSWAIAPSQRGDPYEARLGVAPDDAPPMTTLRDLLAYLATGPAPLIGPPGALMSYQNDGYALLGAVIERASGLPYPEAVERLVTGPLGMERTTFSLDAVRADDDAATLYAETPDGGRVRAPAWETADAHLATGFLKSSARDMLEALAMYLSGGRRGHFALTTERFARLLTPRAWCEPGAGYALGWSVHPDHHGVALMRHGGGLKGVSSHWVFAPDLDLGVVVLTNLEDLPVRALATAAVNAALGIALDTPLLHPPVEEADAGAVEEALGRYRSGEPWGRLELSRRDGAPFARSGRRLEREGEARLAPDGALFVRDGDDWSGGRVVRGEDGAVAGVQLGTRFLRRLGPGGFAAEGDEAAG